jgi:hypothetical protein
LHSNDDKPARSSRRLTLELGSFTSSILIDEAAREGLTIEELVTFSVLYYLADIDSGRISRRIGGSIVALRTPDAFKTRDP